MQLKLTPQTLRYAWGSTTEYWFSRTDYRIYQINDLPTDDDSELVKLGFVPFITICNEEVIRAYIKSLNNPKVSAVFDKLSTYDCVETFWKYFNAYPDISGGFDSFENSYVVEKVGEWCRSYGIDYVIAEE
ncbi:MAG: hypothetical protein J5964_05330 [Eubacterium sp.]|nr:hypothetical protein [Eubacterium sp.]